MLWRPGLLLEGQAVFVQQMDQGGYSSHYIEKEDFVGCGGHDMRYNAFIPGKI